MLSLNRKEDCCGCSSCQQICPKSAIEMTFDEEGFLYPYIHEEKCIDCGLCDKACPVIHTSDHQTDSLRLAYASRSTDAVALANSTSGALSYELARYIIRDGGVVFGACYGKNNCVEHQRIDSEDQLCRIQGSKYVQSNISDTFNEAKHLLECGRSVLFTGTPCQIEGLKAFLKKDHDKLFTQDLICHGTPSPKLWTKYLIETDYLEYDYLAFRGKINGIGWENCPAFIAQNRGERITEFFQKNHFCFFFLQNYSLRPICFECPFKSGYKKSDITCADLWGIDDILPDYNHDDKGMSLVIANTKKGQELLDRLHASERISRTPVSYDKAIEHNMMALRSVKKPELREQFFKDISHMTFKKAYKKYKPKEPLILKVKKKLYPIKQRLVK